jgi:hypothetical protein
MQNEANERVKTMRSRVGEDRVLLSMLDSVLTDAHLKQVLKRASNMLDDVEYLFLDAKILKEPRTAAALTKWLGQGEKVLQFAVQQREFIEDIVETFGPNVRAVSV